MTSEEGLQQMRKSLAIWMMPYIVGDGPLRPRSNLVRSIVQYRLLTDQLGPLPAFVIIGAQRSGTTHLYDLLLRHPNVYPSLAKEIHFFDRYYEKGHQWYQAHFTPGLSESADGTTGTQITGEATPCYLFHPFAAKRLACLAPDTKLIVLLRNPIDRAYSHYHLAQEFGWEHLSFEDALDREESRIAADGVEYFGLNRRRFSYTARGRYAEQLERWLGEFPEDQLLILQAEAFYADPSGVLTQVVDFLGLPAKTPVKTPAPRHLTKSRMNPKTRERLAAYFQPHNEQLFELIGTTYDWDAPPRAHVLPAGPVRQATR